MNNHKPSFGWWSKQFARCNINSPPELSTSHRRRIQIYHSGRYQQHQQMQERNKTLQENYLRCLICFFSFECKWIHRLEKEYRGWSGDSHKLGSRRQEHLQACRKRKCEWFMLNSSEDRLRNRQCSLVLALPRNMWCHRPWMETGAAQQPECSRSNRKRKERCLRPDSWTDSSLTTSWQPRTAPGLFTPSLSCPKKRNVWSSHSSDTRI